MSEAKEEQRHLSVEESETLQALSHKQMPVDKDNPEPIEASEVLEDAENLVSEDEKIVIGDKEFSSQEEALAYARDLQAKGETEKLLHDAYRQGIEDARLATSGANSQHGVTQPEPEEDDDFDQKFFENPKAYLKAMEEKVRKDAMDQALKQIQQQQQDQQLWNEFYSKHPDLAGFDEDCQAVLARESEMIKTLVQTQGKEKAMDYLARKTRAKFQMWAERQRPRAELPQNSPGASPTGGQRVTQPSQEKNEGPVDFVSQMRQHKRALENPS